MNYTELLELALRSALHAGEEILRVYNTNFEVIFKEDESPVTQADKLASESIIRHLSPSQINVLSEEGIQYSYSTRKNWKQIWIVDPLDGTKEFVKRNGEFTVNIALVEEKRPVIGVIYSPVSRLLYFGSKEGGSFKVSGHDVLAELNRPPLNVERIFKAAKKLPLQSHPKNYTVLASRSHLSREVNERINRAKQEHNQVDIINTGSSIKFCWIAEGIAHEYPRYGVTMEWDTAAGQCIIEQTGGKVIDQVTQESLIYNREDLRNNSFIAYCKN